MQKHIRIISMTVIVLGLRCLILAGVVGVISLMAIKNQANSGELDLLPSAITGAIILIPLISIGFLHILTERAFREGAGWARIVMLILAIINLDGLVRSHKRLLLDTEKQEVITSPPSVSRLFTTPTIFSLSILL